MVFQQYCYWSPLYSLQHQFIKALLIGSSLVAAVLLCVNGTIFIRRHTTFTQIILAVLAILDIGIGILLLVTTDSSIRSNITCVYINFRRQGCSYNQTRRISNSKHKQINCSHHPQKNRRVYK